MEYVLTLVGTEPAMMASAADAIADLTGHAPAPAEQDGAVIVIEGPIAGLNPDLRGAIAECLGDRPLDWALQPREGRRKRLLLADMDSTVIGVECLDELADFAGKKAEIAAITEAAMQGRLDFEDALGARVAMLKGLPEAALARCFSERIRLNPGAERLVRTMAAHGAYCALISGGFTYFTARVAAMAGFHTHRGNVFGFEHGALSGTVVAPILGREAKRAALIEFAAERGASPAAALAIGDGANDCEMVALAGLGVAYQAKPALSAVANGHIRSGDLSSALYFQGYRRRDFTAR